MAKSYINYEPKNGEVLDFNLPSFRVVGKRIKDSKVMDIRGVHAESKQDASDMVLFRYRVSSRYVIEEVKNQ